MKILTSKQIKELDAYTIEHEPIKSIDLMERAAMRIVEAIVSRWDQMTPVVVFAGHGNNGGDGLATARLLALKGYDVQVFLFNISGNLSADCAENRQRLIDCKRVTKFLEVTREFDPPQIAPGTLIVDSLFGAGLSKPLAGGFAALVKYINSLEADVVSIDVPSGLMTEDNSFNVRANIIRATLTLTLQQPKLSFFFAENQTYLGEVQVLDIGISPEGLASAKAVYSTIERDEISSRLLRRDRFAHKGSMGHALLIAGSYGMAGAAVLAARATLRAGAGKLTVRVPRRNVQIMQVAVPEAVLSVANEETMYSEAVPTDMYHAVAIGPGLGQSEATSVALISQLRRVQCPIVLDADAINILAVRRAWLQQLPKGTILTPHVGEFDRLESASTESYERLSKARDLAERLESYVVLKGHNTAICYPDGHVDFCLTGNPGMATAGSGDVLTGILLGLLARGYDRETALRIGVYLHGMAGDIAAERVGEESLIASDIIDSLPAAFKTIYAR